MNPFCLSVAGSPPGYRDRFGFRKKDHERVSDRVRCNVRNEDGVGTEEEICATRLTGSPRFRVGEVRIGRWAGLVSREFRG